MVEPKKKYRAVVGITFPDGTRVEAGDKIPADVVVAAWLVEQGKVRVVK